MAVDPVYKIVECVARRYGLPVETVVNPAGGPWHPSRRARQTSVVLAHEILGLPRDDLEDWFDYASTSSVNHALRRRDVLMAADEMAGFDPGEIRFDGTAPAGADIADILAAIERLGRRLEVIEAAIGVRLGGSSDAR